MASAKPKVVIEESRGEPIIFITSNEQKLVELNLFFEPKNIFFQYEMVDLPEYQGDHDFVAIQKCYSAMQKFEYQPVIIEDTALHFNALYGLPGPYIKYFYKNMGCEGLTKLLAAFEDKSARAVTIIAYWDGLNDQEPMLFRGETKGTIVKPRGNFGFGWDPIFLPENSNKTYAELQFSEKLLISHRGKALNKLLDHLLKVREEKEKIAKERKSYIN